ncbi:lipase [Streptomyces mashuensis]|uniref:Lipase n=1 Tax=Streptomyces mashuensis TaxID=33904 RepID=A0A919B1U8_9ACTN|nr:alpha/beta fold hydrolase [Streptomyces mashuensis]GHF40910.1 lipase [Streptomyces mashuensis]
MRRHRSRRPFAFVRTLLATVALTAAAVAVPLESATVAAAASPTVTSGWNDFRCKPSAAHPRPVVLVHGTLENSFTNWWAFAPYLVNRGFCVYSFDYGKLPGIPTFHGLGPIEDSAAQLSRDVDRVLASTGASKVDIVGHSQGGMMPRYYLKFLGGAPKVNALVGLAPTNHGTTLSGLTRLLDVVPGARDVISAKAPGLTQQVAGSPFMNRLNEGGDTVPGVRYTVVMTKYDEVATPYTTGFLSGPNVRNVVLQDLCGIDLSEHLAAGTIDRLAFQETLNTLDPDHAKPATCASMVS